MEKKVIRVGSVGLGAIWSGVHAPGIERSPDLQLTAVCDIDEQIILFQIEKVFIKLCHFVISFLMIKIHIYFIIILRFCQWVLYQTKYTSIISM